MKKRRAKFLSSDGACISELQIMSKCSDRRECVSMSESTSKEANTGGCCIAQGPASVNRVVTTAETPRNTERHRGGREGKGGKGDRAE